MQLLCNNTILDLYDNTGLQFKHSNPLFAFDKLECERTTQFKLPCTQTNDSILSLARIPAYAGAGMRRRFTAQLQDGTVVKDGYLYVSEFDGKDYTAIFVTGELLGLQAIKNAGNIGDILGDMKDLATWSTYVVTPSYFDPVRYGKTYGGSYNVPSFNLAEMINRAISKLGITAQAAAGTWRVLLKEPKTVGGELPYMMNSYQAWDSNFNTTNELNELVPENDDSVAAFIQTLARKIRYLATNVPNYMYGYIRQFYSGYNDLDLIFPSDLGSDWVLMSFPVNCGQTPADDPSEYKPGGVTYPYTLGVFLGDYSFDYNSVTEQPVFTGTPLAGRTVTVPKGTPFVLLNARTMFEFYTAGSKGWYDLYSSDPITFSIAEKAAVEGNRVGLYNNYPDVTLVDLFKTYAALTGKVLNYDEENGLTYDELNVNTWDVKDLTRVLINKKDVKRVFGEYAQRNLIEFSGDDTQLASDKVTRVYTIENDNIESEKTLQTIPFSEGSRNSPSPLLYIRNTEDKKAPSAFVLGLYRPDVLYMQQVSLPSCAGLQSLCTSSTQIKVDVRLSLFEYEEIKPKTLIQVNGTRYVWTERVWQKDTAQFTLAKIA